MSNLSPDLAELAAVAAFAPSLAQAFASLACDIALVLDAQGVITRVAHSPGSHLAAATRMARMMPSASARSSVRVFSFCCMVSTPLRCLRPMRPDLSACQPPFAMPV